MKTRLTFIDGFAQLIINTHFTVRGDNFILKTLQNFT